MLESRVVRVWRARSELRRLTTYLFHARHGPAGRGGSDTCYTGSPLKVTVTCDVTGGRCVSCSTAGPVGYRVL
ncbi:hypothetical protein J6590_053940 [Homalodisca vitripennis]|nr:hypothetical protein J6590_053940 [Homalodisca vitripennis]